MSPHPPIIAPFSGLRYNQKKTVDLSRVTAPPYDVISNELQGRLYERDPYNVVRLILGRQFPTDSEGDNRYRRAAGDLKKWIQEEVLVLEESPAFYLYEQIFSWKGKGPFSRKGFIALRRLESFEEGKIKPHEKTLEGPKQDRLLLMKACSTNLSPIFSLYSDPEGKMTELLEPHFLSSPNADFKDEEGVRHRLWCVKDQKLFSRTNEVVGSKSLFIADGHHRYETAVTYRNEMRRLNPNLPESSSIHYVMMYFNEMSDPGLLILPTHRVLTHWTSLNPTSFEQQLAKIFQIKSFLMQDRVAFLRELSQEGQRQPTFGLLFPRDGRHLLLKLPKDRIAELPPLRGLPPSTHLVDTFILHRLILHEMLGLKEEDDKNPRYLRFVKETDEAIAAIHDEATSCVFLLNSPPMEILQKVVEEGLVLPPKTTFFYPKLVTGLVFHLEVPFRSSEESDGLKS